MDPIHEKKAGVGGSGSDVTSHAVYDADAPAKTEFYDPSKESLWTRIGLSWESFKRAPGVTGQQVVTGHADNEDVEKDMPMLQPKMKSRHLNMIAALGGSIGTGLFVGSGAALNSGGPAGVLIAWIIIGVMLINVTQALGEMCILYPVSGGFYTLAIRFLDPSFAFAMGWNYVFQWAVVLPLEITVAVTTVNYWNNSLTVAEWITIFYLVIIIACIFGTLGFAEEEFWSSCLKLFVVVMFIFIGIVCAAGGGPSSGEYGTYTGGKYWSNPGGFANGFKGVCSVFVTAAFSFAGTELVGLAGSETPNPRKTLPGAVKGTFWRITIIYVTSLTIIGLLVPYTEPRLIGGGGASASPFVIALARANIDGLDHLINATICISVLSIGLSCVYAGSRTLTALAETGFAPSIFTYVDKSSRPLFSVLAILAFGPIAYVGVAEDTSNQVFTWLLALSGLSTLFTWLSICLCHIRFRAAWKAQGHSLEELPFQAMGGIWGSILGSVLIILVLIAQFYVAIFPIGATLTGGAAAESFFSAYLAVPVMILFYVGGYVWKRQRPKRASEIDLDSGRKSWLTVEEMRAYRAERRNAPWYVRVYRILFSN
ncbi:amino-acid permease inda1 [Hymenopellis radicata]|nr:amino-acid permease inda1 [Hymenopellis radicata]